MSATRRIVSGVLTVSIFLSTAGVAGAQVPIIASGSSSVAPQASDTMAAGLLEGETLAEGRHTGGKFGAGLAIGVLTGLIGTGIGYFVVGPDTMSAEALQRSSGKSADFQLGLKTGWEKKTQSKKRGAFLGGGLLGTAIWIALVASANSGE